MLCSGKTRNYFIGLILLGALVLIHTSCSSVGNETYIQTVEHFLPGEITFSKEDILVNVNHVQDELLQEQVFQGIEPRIKSFNQQCHLEGQAGRLILKINQRSLWEGFSQKNSLAITGEVYNENHELLLQRTLLMSGKDSILQVKFQRKYIGALVDSLTKKWMAIAPLEDKT